MKLNLGCGRNILPGYLNADKYGGEVICDAMHLPFRDGVFEEVLMIHTLEHILDLGLAMREIHRVLTLNCLLKAIVPYGLDYFYDPYHHHAFNLISMDRFCMSDSSCDAAPLFHKVRSEISDYRLPFKWHIHKYIPILPGITQGRDNRTPTRLPLGPRNELTFWLEKI